MMWPCKKCKKFSTTPDGCAEHRPVRPKRSFEDELLAAMTNPSFAEGGVIVSGMTFPKVDTPPEP